MTPRIYVACLAAYNSGVLHGRWIDASTDIDEMRAQIEKMLSESPCPDAEEWAIHDHEGLGDLRGDNDLKAVARAVSLQDLADDQDIPYEVLSQFVNEYCPDGDLEAARREIENRYRGHFTDAADWAHEEAESCDFTIPDWVGGYIDWAGVARDWLMDYAQYEAITGETYLFLA